MGMLLDAMEILEIRRAGAKMLHKAAQDADRGQWLLAQMHAKTGAEILRAAGMLMNGHSAGFALLREPHVRHVLPRSYRPSESRDRRSRVSRRRASRRGRGR
jgi:hypothetical protein